MACRQLQALLQGLGGQEPPDLTDDILVHIRTCRDCQQGFAQLAWEVLRGEPLDCAACRGRFPAYFEATRLDRPLGQMDGGDFLGVVRHLASCAACREQYGALQDLWEAEERGEEGM